MKKILSAVLILSLAVSLCACRIPLDKLFSGFGIMGKEEAPTLQQTDPATENPEDTAPEAPVDTLPIVTTVIDYSREIVSQGGTTVLTHHTVVCPALTAETEDAKAFNQEIYEIYNNAVTTLENYEEGEYIYHMDYRSYEYNGAVALVMNMSASNHFGSVFPAYRVFFYDTAAGKEVTYLEYQELLGYTNEDLRRVLSSDSWLSSIDYDIIWSAVDGETTAVMAQSMDFMDDFCLYVMEESVFD